MKSKLLKLDDTQWISEVPGSSSAVAYRIKEFIPDILRMPAGMSKFQIDNFVLAEREYPGADGKFWQSCREVWTRVAGLRGQWFQYQKSLIELERKKRAYERMEGTSENNNPDHDLDLTLASLEMEEAQFRVIIGRKDLQDVMREIGIFLDQMEKLKPAMKHPEDPEKFQPEFWRKKGIIDDQGNLLIPPRFATPELQGEEES
jgi:hypothetical protein